MRRAIASGMLIFCALFAHAPLRTEGGCDPYRADFDMYAVCKKRGPPARQSTYGGFAYRPMDRDLAQAPLPQQCRDSAGQPVWNGAPEVIEWVYCDNPHSGCEHYLFVQRFLSLDDLRLRDTITPEEKVRAFIQACRQETFGGAHALAYVGMYPFSAHEFLDVLFSIHTAFRPKDAFGPDGLMREGRALAAPPAFRLDSFLLDTSLQPAARNLNAVVREFEAFRKTVAAEADELTKLGYSKHLTRAERDRKGELMQRREVVFVKTFNEQHAAGVLRENKTSNAAAADALKKALSVYSAGDPQRQQFEQVERRLRQALKEFDAVVNAAVDSMARQRKDAELVYHAGDTLFLFLRGTGSTSPKLRTTITIRRPEAPAGQPSEVVGRAFDDPPEMNRQHSILFAIDYQRYWASFFSQPVLMAQPPGNYIATLEVFDDASQSGAKSEFKFSLLP